MKAYLKRANEVEGLPESKKVKKEQCPHAEKCYRKNPHHFMEFDHPHLNKFLEEGDTFVLPDDFPQSRSVVEEQLKIFKSLHRSNTVASNDKASDANSSSKQLESEPSSSSSASKSVKSGGFPEKREKKTSFTPTATSKTVKNCANMKNKIEKAGPYNCFFTKIPDSPNTITQENSITFTDLLCPTLGDLKSSMQINFMIDIMWLMEQYNAENAGKKPLTILYGYEFPNMEMYINKFLPNVSYHLVKMKDPFGTHHSKIGFYLYNDKTLRVVVSTANLYYEDWNHYNQGLWISPACPRLPEDAPETDGAGPTAFKTTLLSYLKHYNLPILKEWIEHVQRADFSDVRVFLVASMPGKHYSPNSGCHLHRVGDLLSKHCVLPVKTTPESEGPLSWGVMAQASSIGSLGKDPAQWLRKVLLRSLASHKNGPLPGTSQATMNVIYPSVENVLSSYYGPDGGGCLPYSKTVNDKQLWFKEYLHQWKADALHRTRAMPHIKSYCRVSPCLQKLAWFLLTSANLSKSAWGGVVGKDNGISVRSYEVGVMFLPKFFDQEYFCIGDCDAGTNKFPFIYDLPLTPYKSADKPWCN